MVRNKRICYTLRKAKKGTLLKMTYATKAAQAIPVELLENEEYMKAKKATGYRRECSNSRNFDDGNFIYTPAYFGRTAWLSSQRRSDYFLFRHSNDFNWPFACLWCRQSPGKISCGNGEGTKVRE